jgi:Asp-tRNA(Asn)/Glu-tRNA(Gln) amidotransferase A subunit family amidase
VLPAGFSQPGGGAPPLPLGLQIMGRAFGEAELLAAAHVVEQTLGLEARVSPVAAM